MSPAPASNNRLEVKFFAKCSLMISEFKELNVRSLSKFDSLFDEECNSNECVLASIILKEQTGTEYKHAFSVDELCKKELLWLGKHSGPILRHVERACATRDW